MSRGSATHDPKATGSGPDLLEVLRPVVEEVRRGHDVLLGETHEKLVDGYRGMTAALVSLTRAQFGGTSPVAEATSALVDATDRAILVALDRGVLTTNIARELHISRRTVNRRLKRLRELSGAETPFQLGRAAHALGWLSDDDESMPDLDAETKT